jgi:hypothetical protein
MEALLSCARTGVSPRGGTLYSTTFPCHNCAKHIVAAGVSRVVFVEPYPKSLAVELHSDSIILANEMKTGEGKGKVRFEPFVGVGARRFMDLFSMTLSSGKKINRKLNGIIVNWTRASALVRVPMMPISYIEQETALSAEIGNKVQKLMGGK